ncbi:hypothetical protein J3R30DRAFT_3809189 [Lentinula aciculospora]|uniref:HAUS augmin-like complex subunit 6 N-terminal domain-containing protein n=1 Tax=Lentinula aciculospora TaxID=153920 RepID=A0A9W8ZZL7_9AGAR|nr:hypothetical protein J3R30DRAFT_3809189 [Lentinula aciculospora]
MNTSQSVLGLPLPLLLLIHLQILQYPHIDDDEFDIHIFDSQKRGLRARIKMMEDLGYWLATKIEGRNILPTYPCIKPSETTAFRTSFAKYLEALRQSCIKENTTPSLWWRDVQTRKSLLEECTGEKFLRLILAFSTHAFFKLRPKPKTDSPPALYYASRLAFVQASQRQWIEIALRLLQREQRLIDLKAQLLVSITSKSQSKYRSLSTARLIALRDSESEEILCQECWKGKSARRVLKFFVSLTGLRIDTAEAQNSGRKLLVQDLPMPSYPRPEPQLLPVAAARHPAHLQRLKKPIFQLAEPEFAAISKKSKSSEWNSRTSPKLASSFDYAAFTLRDHRETEEHVRVVLERMLKRLEMETKRLEKKLNALKSKKGQESKANPKTMFQVNDRKTTEPNQRVAPPLPSRNEMKMVNVARKFSFWEDRQIIDVAKGRSAQLDFERPFKRDAGIGINASLSRDLTNDIRRDFERVPSSVTN